MQWHPACLSARFTLDRQDVPPITDESGAMRLAEKILRFIIQFIVVGGSIVSLVTFGVLFGSDVLRYVGDHLPVILAIITIIGLVVLYGFLVWGMAKLALRLLRLMIERRELHSLAVDIAYLRQLTAERHMQFQLPESERPFYINIDEVIERQKGN